jgi:hypothetical protein
MINTHVVANLVALDTSHTLITSIWLEWIRFLLMFLKPPKTILIKPSYNKHAIGVSQNTTKQEMDLTN